MNKTVDTKLAIAIIVVVAILVGGIILILSSNNQVAQAPSQVANKSISKNDQQSISQENKDKVHMAFMTEVNGKVRVIYDGKDMGISCDEIFDESLSGNDIIFDCRQGKNTSGGEGHIILNGKDLGEGFRPNVENGNVSFLRQISENNVHLIFNSQDVGEVHSGQDWHFETSNSHYMMERMINGKVHTILDGKDMGESNDISILLGENSIAIIKYEKGVAHLTYNGKDIANPNLASGNTIRFNTATDNHVTYYIDEDKSGNTYFYKNDQNLGKVNSQMSPFYIDGNFCFMNEKGEIIYNGMNFGLIKLLGSGGYPAYSKGHVIFTRGESGKKEHIIYDGKDLGEGVNPTISGDNIAYNIEVGGKQHILFNGKDMGEGTEPQLAGDNLVFYLEKQGVKHVIYNGKDLGEAGSVYFSEN